MNDHLLVRVFAGNGIFHGFYHFDMVFAGAGVAARWATRAFLETFLAMTFRVYELDEEMQRRLPLLDFAVYGVLAQNRVVFFQFQTLRRVLTVLLGDVA